MCIGPKSLESAFQFEALREILRAKEALQDDRRLRASEKKKSELPSKVILSLFACVHSAW